MILRKWINIETCRVSRWSESNTHRQCSQLKNIANGEANISGYWRSSYGNEKNRKIKEKNLEPDSNWAPHSNLTRATSEFRRERAENAWRACVWSTHSGWFSSLNILCSSHLCLCFWLRKNEWLFAFRARITICKTPTRLFCKARLFICCKGMENENNCKVSCL